MDKAEKARQEIARLFQVEIKAPLETINDLMREAQAVINYFETGGAGFKDVSCKYCGLTFAYSWDVQGVRYCSVPCMDGALREVGLKWNPTRPPAERWGKTVPAVVPPAALQNLQDLLGIPEVHSDNT